MKKALPKPILLDDAFARLSPRERGRLVVRTIGELMLAAAAADDPLLTTREGAELIGRDEETVRLWCKSGQLGYFDRSDGPRGRYRFRRSELIAYFIRRFGADALPAKLRD